MQSLYNNFRQLTRFSHRIKTLVTPALGLLLVIEIFGSACSDPAQEVSSAHSATTALPQTWRAWWYELKNRNGQPLLRYDFDVARGALVETGPITATEIYIARPTPSEAGPWDSRPADGGFAHQSWLLARSKEGSYIYNANTPSDDWFFVHADTITLPPLYKEYEGKWYLDNKWYPASWPLRQRKRLACPIFKFDSQGRVVPLATTSEPQFSLAQHPPWNVWFDANETITLGSAHCEATAKPRKVLVLDDTDSIRKGLVQALQTRTDWSVFEAATLARGLEILAEHTASDQPLDAILADFSLGYDRETFEETVGTQLLEEAMHTSPLTYRILITGARYSEHEEIPQAKERGVIQSGYYEARDKVGELSYIISMLEKHFAEQPEH